MKDCQRGIERHGKEVCPEARSSIDQVNLAAPRTLSARWRGVPSCNLRKELRLRGDSAGKKEVLAFKASTFEVELLVPYQRGSRRSCESLKLGIGECVENLADCGSPGR